MSEATFMNLPLPMFPRAALLSLPLVLALAGCPGPTVPEPLPEVPRILLFEASAATLGEAGPVTLSWKVEAAAEVTITHGAQGAVSGVDDRLEGTVEVQVNEDALFVLTATNARGVRVSEVLGVQVDPGAALALLVATPQAVTAGESTVLAWTAPGARSVTVTDGAGAALDLLGQTTSGSISVTPEVNTTYVLTADGITREAQVAVLPAVFSFTADVDVAIPGEQVTLSWQTGGAVQVSLQVPGREDVYTSATAAEAREGSHTLQVPAGLGEDEAFSVRLLAQGAHPDHSASRVVTLYVAGSPRIRTFEVPQYALTGSTFPIAWTTANAVRVELAAAGTVIAEVDDPARVKAWSMQVQAPTSATVYTLTVTDGRGVSDVESATVDPVGVPQVMTFEASPDSGVVAGAPVTLTWEVPNARNLRIVEEGESTVFSVKGLSAAAGSITVYPNANATYRLEADNTVGDAVQAQKPVGVATPGALTLSPGGSVIEGSAVTVESAAVPPGTPIVGLAHSHITFDPMSTGFVDIEGIGTEVTMGTTTTARATFVPDFETWLFGRRVDGPVTVSVNGHMAFGTTVTSATSNKPLPNTTVDENFLAPLWLYLRYVEESAIHWAVLGEAPERVLVVQWSRMDVNGNLGSVMTFQAQVHQSGKVRYEYQTLQTTASLSPVIGVQGPADGYLGLMAQTGVPAENSAITFFGPTALPATVQVFPGEATLSGFAQLGDAYLRLPVTLPETLPVGLVRITEVMPQPAAALAATGEWLELYNPGTTAVDVAGWTLEFPSGSHTITSANGTTVVPPEGVLVFGQTDDPALNDGVAVDYVYGTAFTLPDAVGAVSLNKVGAADSLSWTGGTAGASHVFDPGPVYYAADTTGMVPRGLQCVATSPFGTQAPQQLGTPGKAGGCLAYTLSHIPADFEDISADGEDVLPAVTGTTGYRANIPLPAPFTYYGVPYTQFHASTSGIISFGTATGQVMTTTYTANGSKPASGAPNNAIAVFWDSVYRRPEGMLQMKRNADHTILSWNNFRYSSDSNGDYSFQVKLFDSGVIEMHYGAMTSGSSTYDNQATGSSATTWLEDATGTSAIVANINTAGGISPLVAFRFTPN